MAHEWLGLFSNLSPEEHCGASSGPGADSAKTAARRKDGLDHKSGIFLSPFDREGRP